MATPLTIGIASFVHIVCMTVLLRRFYATLLVLCALSASSLLAQSGASTPDRIVSPVRTDLPGRTVWAFATTGTGTNITTFAATDKGLYKSSGGAWSLTSLDKQSVYAVKSRDIGRTSTLLVGTDKGVLRSTDGGNTWASPEVTTGTAIATSNIVSLKKVFDIEIVQPGNGNGNGNAGVWFAATEKGVYRSSNDGRSWSLVNIDRTADNNEVRGITTDGNTIIVNLWKEGLWRSTNNGNSWTKLTIPGETALCRAVHAQQGTNATIWLAGSVSGNIWRSVNSGTSWSRVYQGTSAARSIAASALTQAGVDAITGWERSGKRGERYIYLFASTPTGIAYSLTEGQTWELSRTPAATKAIALTAWDNSLYVGSENESGGSSQEFVILNEGKGSTSVAATENTAVFTSSGKKQGATLNDNVVLIPPPVITRTGQNKFTTYTVNSWAVQKYTVPDFVLFGTNFFTFAGFPLTIDVTPENPSNSVPSYAANGQWINNEQVGWIHFSTYFGNGQYGDVGWFSQGRYFVKIYNITGVSNTVFLEVGPKYMDFLFSALTPLTAAASTTVSGTITGSGMDGTTQLLLNGTEASNISYTRDPNGTSIAVNFTAPAVSGNYPTTLRRQGTPDVSGPIFTVVSPIPELQSVTTDPSPARVGQTAIMTIGGQKFAADAQVRIYGPNNTVTTYNPTTRNGSIGMTVSFTPPTTPGVYAVDVVNPGAAGPSEQTTYMVAYPTPTLTAIAPTRVIQNLSATLSLTGTGIISGVTQFGLSSGLSSTLSGASVTFTAPAKGTYSASLTNSTTYGGGGTATLNNALTVVAPNPAPASLTLDSTRLLVNDGVRTLTLTGTGFLTGSNSDDNARTAVTVDGASVTPQSISATQIVLSVPTAGANAGAHTIALTNPAVFSMASGGGGTASTTYSVAFPTPTLTSLDADSLDLNIGTTPQTLTLTGTGFVNASRVFAVARELTVTSRTATSLVVTIPAGFFTEPTTVAVRVDNLTSGVTPADGGSSGTKSLTIKNLLPTLTSVSPAPVIAGENATLTLAGTNFIANTSQVYAGSTALVTTVSSANSLTAALPASLVADIGTLSLTVRNTFGTDIKTSLPKSLRVIHPTPEVTALAPVTIPAFDSTQTLTVSGAKFSLTRSRVIWSKNGVETPLTLLPNPTSTQLRVTVPASLLTELGSVTVRVQNVDSADANGGPSASSTLTIIPPRPVVTSVAPNSATAGAGAVTVTITGAKFIQSGLSILIRNAQNGFVRGLLNPTFTSNTSVSGTIPADVVTLAGNYTITVVNAANASGQGGGESTTSAPFTILNPAPTIASLTPNPATVFAPFTLEIQGTGFVSGATSVVVDGQTFPPASVTVLSSVRLTVNVAAVTSAKNAGVSVTNPKLNNQGGGTATTTLPVVPPVPTVSQAQGNGGSGTLTRNVAGVLTVTGTGFVTGAVIVFNGQDLTTTVVDQTTVRANVAASALPTQGVYAVSVRNPQFGNQGGGTSSPVVGVTVQNPTPTLSGINPTAVTRGNDASITLTGNNFYDGAVAYLSGASSSTFATVFVNNGSLTLSIPASSLPVAGSYSIAVKNAEPTPGFSGTKTLTVNNPAPVLSSLSVTETEAYSSDVTLTVTGSGFENGLMAWWTPSGSARQALPAPTSVSANSCTLSIPAAMLTRAGAFTITLENAAPSLGASAPATFTVLDRVPTLTSVAPNPIEALSGNTQITLTGDYFAPNADALWNGEVLARVSVNRTTLVATVPASRLTLATVAQITVRNPQFSGRGGGTSTPAQNLVITNPAPHLTSLTPAFTVAVTSGTGAVVTLNGRAFMPVSTVEMSVSDSVGTPSGVWSVFPSTYQSASRISVFLPDALLHQPVVFTLRVVSPQVSNQGGGASEERLFTVRAPVPVLTALVPTVATLNAQTGDVLLRVEGANFTNTSLVRIANVPVPTRYLSPTALEATVQRPASAYTVTVNNPPVNAGGIPQGGGTSSGLRLVIVNPVPTLTAVQPSTLASTGAPDTLTLKGTNFITGVKVLYNGTALAAASVTVVNDSTLRVLIPALPIAVTTHTLAVQQPSIITGGETFGGAITVALPLSIVFPVPTLTSLSPASTAATLNPNTTPNNWTLTVRGTLFANNAVVLWNGQTLTTSVVNSTTLRATVPNTLAQDSGTALIRVKNDVVPSAPNGTPQGGGTSADSLTLGIYYPVPVLTGIAPDFTMAATLTRLTLTGTNFAPGSGVQLSATFLPAVMLQDVQVISPTEVQASIPATLLGTRGTYSVRVISPPTASAQGGNPVGGGQSAAKTLTAVNPAPVLTALLPNTTTASGKAWTLTLVGRSFTATSQVRYNGVLQSLAATQFIPMTNALMTNDFDTLRVKLPAVPVNDTTFFLSVYNPPSTVNGQPSGGGESDTLRLAVGLPFPTITSISPATTTATLGDRARAWTLTMNGTFFDNAAKVFVGGLEVPSEFVAATRLRVVLPDSMQFFQARRTVQVRNTPTLTSNLVSLTVQNPAPVLTAIAPSTILAGRDTTIVFAGDRFAPTSTVRLTYGTTNTFLTPTLRDSVISLTVTIPGALTRTKGAYTLRVSNPALTPTMVPPDTLLLGGGFSAAQTLTVNAGGAASVEYIGLDTLLYAGDRLWFFTLRFRDAVGNLVDNDPVTLTYTNVDTASTNGTSVTGTFPMTRTSLGNYRADTLRFPVAGVYALTVDTAQTGALTVIGANRFTVLTRPAVRVDMTGLKETLSAGETQHVQARYYDNQNNLTDNSVRPVIVTAPLAGGYRYVLGYTRLSTGVYDMETVRYTTSGNYTISFTGIDTLNITGNGVPYNRRFTVQTIPAASVRFTNVNPFLTAGNTQNRFTAAFRDTFGNLTDALTTEQLVVQYSNSTTANVGDSIVTGAITLSRLSLGTYQADVAERFPVVGSYNFTVQGILATSGTAAFRVQAAGDARVEFAGVRDTLVAGDSLQNVTLKYWDVNGNLTDNNLGDIILTKRSPAPTFTARMAKTRILAGVYAVQTTEATISGNYDLTVLGITAANTGGNKNIVVVPASVTNVDFVITTTAMTRTGARAYITATYHDRFGNLADFAGDLTLSNSEYASVATVSMTRQSPGVYKGSVTLYAPGAYAVQIAGNSANITIGGTEAFALEPGPAVRADFQNVLPALTAGTNQSAFTVLLRDRRGSPTDVWNGAIAFDAPASGVTGTVSYDWDNGNPAMYGIITATPTTFNTSGTYTFSLNGGITQHVGTRTFAVSPAPAQTAYILTTPANATVTAGAAVSLRVRFTDSFGNLTPVTNSIMLQQAGTTLATSPLAATGTKGEYTAVFRPATSGTLTFALDTPVMIAGTTAITVLPTTDYRVELDGVKTQMIAGETQNPFTVTYRDRYGNLTDSTVGAVIVRLVGGTERDTLQMQRLAKGEYKAEALTVTKVGTYLITISGISTLNITGDSAFVVTPDVAAQALFQSVPTAINVNANLPAFTVRYRDRFDNPVDYNGTVGFTNSASPFVQAGLTPLNAQAIPMARTALAVSTATLTPVSVAGDYALTVQGLTTLTGTIAFTVRPLAAASAEIRNVQERVSAGDSLPPFIVLYRDRMGNVADYNRNVTLTRTGTTASLTVPMKRIAIGVSTASVATALVTPGTYRLSVPGLTTVSGATTVVVVSTNAVSKVDFWGVTPTLTAGEKQESVTVSLLNSVNQPVSLTNATLRFQNVENTSSGTLNLLEVSPGTYSVEIASFMRIGHYRFSMNNVVNTTGTFSFDVIGGSLTSIRIDSLPQQIVAEQTIPPFYISLFDSFGNLLQQSYSVFLGNTTGTFHSMLSPTLLPNGTMKVSQLEIATTGTYSLSFLDSSLTIIGNKVISVLQIQPIIADMQPQILFTQQAVEITLTGKNFDEDAQIIYKGMTLTTSRLNSSNLTAIIPKELTMNAGIDSLFVLNPRKEVTSNKIAAALLLGCAGGTIITIDASSNRICFDLPSNPFAECDNKDTPIFQIGFNEFKNVTVSDGGKTYEVTFDTEDEKRAIRNIGNGSKTGTLYKEKCKSKTENGSTTWTPAVSASIGITIKNPVPTLDSIKYQNKPITAPIAIQSNTLGASRSVPAGLFRFLGKSFVNSFPGSSRIKINIGGIETTETPTYDSSTSLTSNVNVRFPIGQTQISSDVYVFNPEPGGGSSSSKNITFALTGPIINALTTPKDFIPNPVVGVPFGVDTTIRIWGDNFTPGMRVTIRGTGTNPKDVIVHSSINPTSAPANSGRGLSYIDIRLTSNQILEANNNDSASIFDKAHNITITDNSNNVSNIQQLYIGKPFVKIVFLNGNIDAGRTSDLVITGTGFIPNTFSGSTQVLVNNAAPLSLKFDRNTTPGQQRLIATVIGDKLNAGNGNRVSVSNQFNSYYTYNHQADSVFRASPLTPTIKNVFHKDKGGQPSMKVTGIIRQDTTLFVYGDSITHQTALFFQGQIFDSLSKITDNTYTLGYNYDTKFRFQIHLDKARLQHGRRESIQLVNSQVTPTEKANLAKWSYSPNSYSFNVYDLDSLPRVDSIQPKRMTATENSLIRVFGNQFDADTRIRLTLRRCGGEATAEQTIVITPTFINKRELSLNIPDTFRQSGLITFRALNIDSLFRADSTILFIKDSLPTIDGVQTFFEIQESNFIDVLGKRIPWFGTHPVPIYKDSLFTGTNGLTVPQKYFLVKGRHFNSGCFSNNNDTAKVFFNGRAIKASEVTDSTIRFGLTSTATGSEQFLTFTPGAYPIKVQDKDGFISNDTTVTVYARTPSIGDARSVKGAGYIDIPYNGFDTILLTSGDSRTKPQAKDFISTSGIRLTGVDDIPRESFTVKFDTSSFSLQAIIRATDVPFVKRQENNAVILPDEEPNPNAYQSRPAQVRVLNSTPFLSAGSNSISNSANLYFRFVYPPPSITGLQPAKIPVDDKDTVVTITGTNFISGETMTYIEQRIGEPFGFGNLRRRVRTDISTRVIDSTHLAVTIPPYLRNEARKDTLVVFNGTFGSNTVVLDVVPVPRITYAKPDTLAARILGEPEPTDTLVTIRGKYLTNTLVFWNQDTTISLPILPGRTDTEMQVIVPTTYYSVYHPFSIATPRDNNGLYSLFLRYPNLNYGTASTPITLIYADAIIDTVRPDTIEIPVSAAFLALKDDASLTSGNGQRGEFPVYAGLPITVELFPNAPNPFDGQTTIEYAVPDDATLGIEIYDPLGKRIADLVPRKLHKAGFYSVQWNAGHQTASGIYTAVLQSIDGKGKLTRKTIRMTLIR